MNGFNPNFVFTYESGNSITVSFNNFTSNSFDCIIMSHILRPSDQDNYLPAYFGKATFIENIQSFDFDLTNINFGQPYLFKIEVIAAAIK